MRQIEGVVVTAGIVHLVAPRKGERVLSDLPLEKSDEVFGFLGEHVQGGLKDPQEMAASFVAVGPGRTSDLCDTLLSDATQLVPASQKLAERLYDVTSKDGRISDGTLAVLLCDGRSNETSIRFVALLKLDPANGFRPVAESDARGRNVVRLELEKDILPSTRERLQKAAFVGVEGVADEYRILVVDRQTALEPAQFFLTQFLGAEPALDSIERTKRLHRALTQARNEVAPELSSQKLVALDRVIEGAMSSTAINVDDFVETLPVPTAVRETIDERIARELPDRQFDLDAELGRKLVRRRNFEGDNGLRLSVPAEFFDQMVKVEDIPGTDPVVRRITIETQLWREK